MMKYFILLLLVAAIWWRWRKKSSPSPADRKTSVAPAENMVACAYCGVFLPQSEALEESDAWYCCAAHRIAGPRRSAGQ